MSDFDLVRWAVSHDPCRAGDRTPSGAVPAGTIVHLTLRVAAEARGSVSAAEMLVGERTQPSGGFSWSEEALVPSDDGYAGFLALDAAPYVAFYAFRVHLADGACAYYVPRVDGRATAGDLVAPGVDGEWTDCGWRYAPSRLEGRPRGDFGLPEMLPGFQLTVYEPGFKTPDWLAGAIMYQVFPDRFDRGPEGVRTEGMAYRAQMERPTHLHDSWDDPVGWSAGAAATDSPDAPGMPGPAGEGADNADAGLPDGGGYDPVDFFGGTLSGIRSRLGYLASLGVEAMYVNPVFEARSCHRYDTADYERVDPLLGDADELRDLIDEARELGISVILDAVLSHTGNDSRYFNSAGSYDAPGAAQGPHSPFHSWYDFNAGGAGVPYRCWWGDPTLPEVDERDPSWQRYMFDAETGVLPRWIDAGARGYRLDVADEIPDDVLELIRGCVKAADPEAAIIGEVWEDATTKTSYDSPRTYALGGSLDSVMNYPLRSALIGFALGRVDAYQLSSFLRLQQSNYPAPLYSCLMNLLASHDVERLRSVLALGHPLRHEPRAEQRRQVASITQAQDARGERLQRMVVALLYALPGSPCLYYGDERGMQGGGDPFCRATFPAGEGPARGRADCGRDLTRFYRQLGQMRKGSDALKHGTFACTAPDADVICLIRVSRRDGTAVVAAANRSAERRTVAFDASSPELGLPSGSRWAVKHVEAAGGLAGDAAFRCEDGVICVTAPAGSTTFWVMQLAN